MKIYVVMCQGWEGFNNNYAVAYYLTKEKADEHAAGSSDYYVKEEETED